MSCLVERCLLAREVFLNRTLNHLRLLPWVHTARVHRSPAPFANGQNRLTCEHFDSPSIVAVCSVRLFPDRPFDGMTLKDIEAGT